MSVKNAINNAVVAFEGIAGFQDIMGCMYIFFVRISNMMVRVPLDLNIAATM